MHIYWKEGRKEGMDEGVMGTKGRGMRKRHDRERFMHRNEWAREGNKGQKRGYGR